MRAALAILAVSFALTPSAARAHGREPSVGQLEFDPSDEAHIVARATWGFVTTRDGGETWTWQCAQSVPFDRTREDPNFTIVASGRLLAGTFDEIVRSDPRACAWTPDPTIRGVYVVDVQRDPVMPTRAWALASSGRVPDVVWRSDDEGATWEMAGEPHVDALSDRIRVAPSDPMRLYASGVIPRVGDTPAQGLVLRSDDGGATWAPHPIDLLLDADTTRRWNERTIHVMAVDPTNADRVFARTVRGVTDEIPERVLVSDDGALTWREVARRTEIVGLVISPDGRRLWLGSWDGGLLRSVDGGETWTTLDEEERVRCLAYRETTAGARELWMCIEGFTGAFAIGRSLDEGETFEPMWRFEDSSADVGCPAGTPVGDTCPMFWPDQQFDLMLTDGAVPDAGMDGGSGPPTPAPSTCACRASGRPRTGGAAAIALVVAIAARVRARSRRAASRL